MADPKFKPGKEKTGGRKPGTPNKKTLEFQAILEANNFDPGQALIEIYNEQMKLFNLMRKKSARNLTGAAELLCKAEKTINDICGYVYPRKKAIEHTGEVGVKTFADFMAAGVAAAKGKK